MAKCHHNNNFTNFCIKKQCHHSLAGGCNSCFTQDHSHSSKPQLISADQLKNLMKRYLFSKKIKPQCNSIQEAFFSYFRLLKSYLAHIVQNMEDLCKNVVNSVGFPYLSNGGYFKVYKRIKNNDLSKITPQQLSDFVNQTQGISNEKLVAEQEQLYLSYVGKYYQMIKQIDSSVSTLMNILTLSGSSSKLTHNSDGVNKIKQLVTKIQVQKNTMIVKNNFSGKLIRQKQSENSIKCNNSDKSFNILKRQNHGLTVKVEKILNKQRKKSIHQQKFFALFKVEEAESPENNQNSFIKQKNKEEQLSPLRTNKPSRRTRRSSIDNQLLFKNTKLEKKIAELKNNKAVEPVQKQKEWSEDNDNDNTQSSKQIQNYDLPQADSNRKVVEVNQQIEVIPITRKFTQDMTKDNEAFECQSPLIKRKKQLRESKNLKQSLNSSQSSKMENPYFLESPAKTTLHGVKNRIYEKQLVQQRPGKNSQRTSELSEKQQISYMLLTKALSLKAEQAIILLQRSLLESQNNLSSAQYLSFLYLESNRPKKCLDLCNKYLSKIKNHPQVSDSILLLICNKSGALNVLGRFSQTIKLLETFQNQNQMVLKNLANAYLSLGKYQEAISLYKKAIQDCHDDEVYYNLSVCLYMKQDYKTARLTLQSALVSQPNKEQYLQLERNITMKIPDRSQLHQMLTKQTFMKKN